MGNFAQGRVLLEKKTHPSKRPVVKPSDFRFCFSILCCERVPLQTRKTPPSKRKICSPMEIHPLGILPARCRWVHPMASDQVASGDGSAVLDDLEATEPAPRNGRGGSMKSPGLGPRILSLCFFHVPGQPLFWGYLSFFDPQPNWRDARGLLRLGVRATDEH